MKIDIALTSSPGAMRSAALQAEQSGFDGGWTVETCHDPFVLTSIAAATTRQLEVGTAIAVAFGRTPLTVAHAGWDLQALSAGRFSLGLGSQIRPHIEKRYSMPWSAPAARMREFVLAVRAIWESWERGGRLNFRGDFFINISSIGAIVGSRVSAYGSSKGAVRSLSKSAAVNLATYGIRVNSIHPGVVVTDMTSVMRGTPESRRATIARYPMARLAEPGEIADGVLYLASERSSFVTGAELVIDGGLTAW